MSKEFTEATKDYKYLLERNYPQKSLLKLVGDKYQLSSLERSILFRGIVTDEQSLNRKKKKASELGTSTKLFIDGYNVIRSVGSYLLGRTVFISQDGFLRDASEMHRSTLKIETLDNVVQLLLNFLKKVHPVHVMIYLDQPVSKSGELAAKLNEKIGDHQLVGKAITVHSPDHHLALAEEGIVCTADSVVIDNCQVQVFDLAMAILKDNFDIKIMELSSSYQIEKE